MASAVMLLPQPDSPTRAMVLPASTAKDSDSRTGTPPPGWPSETVRSRISSAAVTASPFAQARVKRIVDAVANQADAEYRNEDGRAGHQHGPPGIEYIVAVLPHHHAPAHLVRIAEAEKAEATLEQDGDADAESGGHDDGRQGLDRKRGGEGKRGTG